MAAFFGGFWAITAHQNVGSAWELHGLKLETHRCGNLRGKLTRNAACGCLCGWCETIYTVAIRLLFLSAMAPKWSRLQQHVAEYDQNMLIIIAMALKIVQLKKQKRRRHRWWVHNKIQQRYQLGVYHNLVQELQLDGERFLQYFRLTREQFTQVLFYVERDLVKHSLSRDVICPRQRLAICLR